MWVLFLFILFCFVSLFVCLFVCFVLYVLFCFVLFCFVLFCFFAYVFVVKLGGSRLTYWDLDVSSFFLLSSFFLSFSQSASSSTCLIGFLPNLVRSKYGWMATKLMGLKIHPGSFGVTGVKKMIL